MPLGGKGQLLRINTVILTIAGTLLSQCGDKWTTTYSVNEKGGSMQMKCLCELRFFFFCNNVGGRTGDY